MKATVPRNGIIAAAVLFAALTLTSVVQAQPGSRSPNGRFMGGGPRGMLPGVRNLDLTDAQREAIRDIAKQNRGKGSAMAEQLVAARSALQEAVTDDVVNESLIRALAADVANLEADAAVQRAHANAQILQLLTPDQRAELRKLQTEAQERMGERRGRRQGRR
jgi:Spy/CpxP family protein refolding chaperone